MTRVVVVDYHKGNLSSVARGVGAVGGEATISDDPHCIVAADALIMPGVGSFEDALTYMRERGQASAVLDFIASGKPFLGICLGLQVLFDRGSERADGSAPFGDPSGDSDGCGRERTEGAEIERADSTENGRAAGTSETQWVQGLGVLRGSATRLTSRRLKIPHVGWDQLDMTEHGRACPLLEGVADGCMMYFTHSYAVSDAQDEIVAARTHYASSFASVIWQDNVFGTQFHPEKSSRKGLAILSNFLRIVDAS